MKIFTDGAYSQKNNKGGYSFVVYQNDTLIKKYLKKIENSTNQRAEMLAVIDAFRYILQSEIQEVTIVTDSMYIIGTVTMNWKISCNKDLWDIFFKLMGLIKIPIHFTHVKGHANSIGNNKADLLAVLASESIEL